MHEAEWIQCGHIAGVMHKYGVPVRRVRKYWDNKGEESVLFGPKRPVAAYQHVDVKAFAAIVEARSWQPFPEERYTELLQILERMDALQVLAQ
jgi:hypothetical protein